MWVLHNDPFAPPLYLYLVSARHQQLEVRSRWPSLVFRSPFLQPALNEELLMASKAGSVGRILAALDGGA